MLRYKHDFDIKQRLIELSENGIDLHTQIVIVPSWNDGEVLIQTLNELTSPAINALSVGIVPVGLTKFRQSLSDIDPLNKSQAEKIIEIAGNYSYVYCSDEIFLLAEKEIPAEEYYDDYPQLENGIGMIRLFWENWTDNKRKFIKEIKKRKENLVLITGILAKPEIKKLSQQLNYALPGKSRVQSVVNDFLGDTVTVTGLLSATDIFEQVKLNQNEIPVISNNIFNSEGFTLDDIDINEFKQHFQSRILVIDEEFNNWEFI
jgi:NifB/MoaA-like Fe-S oxidoreductase